MTIIFSAKIPKKEKVEENRRDVTIVDFAHSARSKQRVYCNNHINKIVMTYDELKKNYYCIGCGATIHAGYGQSLMKKRKEDIKYSIITDPYAPENIKKHDGTKMRPLGFVVGGDKLQDLESIKKKETSTYKSAVEASQDIFEEWYLQTHG